MFPCVLNKITPRPGYQKHRIVQKSSQNCFSIHNFSLLSCWPAVTIIFEMLRRASYLPRKKQTIISHGFMDVSPTVLIHWCNMECATPIHSTPATEWWTPVRTPAFISKQLDSLCVTGQSPMLELSWLQFI